MQRTMHLKHTHELCGSSEDQTHSVGFCEFRNFMQSQQRENNKQHYGSTSLPHINTINNNRSRANAKQKL